MQGMLTYQPAPLPSCMMETTGYYDNTMDNQTNSYMNGVEFGESCLYAAAAAAIVGPPPPTNNITPPTTAVNHTPFPQNTHQAPPPQLSTNHYTLDPSGAPPPYVPGQVQHHPPHPPQYNGMDHMSSTGPQGMDIKVEPDTIMDDYSPVSYMGSTSPSSQSSPIGGMPGGRMRKQKEDKICGVCGDKALGYNFDAISCESCKAFFRRNAPKGLDYFKCPYDEKCKMDVSNRRFCKRCRLKKCFEIGMRKEYILTEDEKARKRQKIEENRHTTTNSGSKSKMEREWLMKDLERQGILTRSNSNPGMGAEVSSQSRMMSPEDQASIEEIMTAYQSSLNIQMDVDVPRDQANDFGDLVNIAELSVRRVIAMAKQIKSFKVLPQSDQIALLKGGSIELLILRSVVSFDKEKQQFLDSNDQENEKALKIEQFKKAGTGDLLFEEHMKFVKALAVDLGADQTTLLLLLVISLFSPDRDNLSQKEHISQQQEHYSMLLSNYLDAAYTYPVARVLLPKLLMKLTDIRNLNEEHSQVLLKVNPEGIHPLMKEVLDLSQ